MMAKKSTPQQLVRLVRAKKRLSELNSRRPAHMRQTEDQMDRVTRRAMQENRINDYGVILKKES